MLFRRRQSPPLWARMREMIWPRSGWERAVQYIWHRTVRLPDTPHGIAAGIACGLAISFTPFIGFHFAGACLLAWLLRGNLLAACLGTFIGNPWTFPFIWVGIYRLGAALLGIQIEGDPSAMLAFGPLMADPWGTIPPIFLPMAVGGILSGTVVWFLSYWPMRRIIERYRARRLARIGRVDGMKGPSDGAGASAGR